MEVGSKHKKTPLSRYSGHNTPLGYHTGRSPTGPGQYNNLGEYCGPHTTPSVFLMLVLNIKMLSLFLMVNVRTQSIVLDLLGKQA